MACFRAVSLTPSEGSDAPIPETVQDEAPKSQVPKKKPLIPVQCSCFPHRFWSDFPARPPPRLSSRLRKRSAFSMLVTWVSALLLHIALNANLRGKLHPRAKHGDLCDLFKPFGGGNVVIRTSRGCGVLPVSDEEMGPNDRCYATINIAGIEETQQAIREFHGSKAPIVEGIPIVVTPNPVDLPEVAATIERYFDSPSGAEEKCVNSPICSLGLSLTMDSDALGGEPNDSPYRKPSW